MSSPVTVRSATRDDVIRIADLDLQLYPDPWAPAYFMDIVDGKLPTLALDVAEYGSEFAGYLVTSVVFEMAEIQRITTVPEHQSKGVATALVGEFFELAADNGVERILLEVRASNAIAIRLYVSAGFEQIDRRPAYYSDGEDALVFALDVNPPEEL